MATDPDIDVIDPDLQQFLEDDKISDKKEDEIKPEGEVEAKGEGEADEKPELELKDEELDAASVYPRPSYKDIVTKYPKLFKDFPDLRQSFFREQKFTEIFPTIEEATPASEESEDYKAIVSDLQHGNISNIIDVLDGDQLKNAAASFLPSLYKKDQEVYFAVTGPLLDNFIKQAFKAAEQSGDEDLKASAQWIAKWAFGDFAFASGGKHVQPLNKPATDSKLDEDRKTYESQKFNENYNAVVDTGLKALKNNIVAGLSDVTSSTLKDMITKRVEEEVSEALERDPSHVRRMDALWKRARGAGFVGDHKTRILSTYLARAKSLVPAIRSRIKAEVVGQSSVTAAPEKPTASTMPSGSQARVTSKLPDDPTKIDWKRTSDMDAIRGQATLKGR